MKGGGGGGDGSSGGGGGTAAQRRELWDPHVAAGWVGTVPVPSAASPQFTALLITAVPPYNLP